MKNEKRISVRRFENEGSVDRRQLTSISVELRCDVCRSHRKDVSVVRAMATRREVGVPVSETDAAAAAAERRRCHLHRHHRRR